MDKVLIEKLRKARAKIQPVVVNKGTGYVVSGRHRLQADPSWNKIEVDLTPLEEILQRLEDECLRKDYKNHKETMEQTLRELWNYYDQVPYKFPNTTKISRAMQDTGFCQTTIYKYLPDDLKRSSGYITNSAPRNSESIVLCEHNQCPICLKNIQHRKSMAAQRSDADYSEELQREYCKDESTQEEG